MPSTFTYANNTTANNTSAGALILRPPDGFYAVGATYRFPALQVNTSLSFFSNGNPYEKRDVKYIVGTDERLNADDVNTHAPADLNKTSVANATPIKNHIFINGDNGDMLIQFPHFQPKHTTKSYAITLEVIDPAGAIQVLERMLLQVRYRDTDLDGYGPNGHPCLHGALIDLAPFDGSFACDCSNTGFGGANCANDSRADRKSESTDGAGSSTADLSTAIVVIVLSIIILLVGGGAALHSYKARKDRLQPVDFEEVHDRMLGSGELTPQHQEDGKKANGQIAIAEAEMIKEAVIMALVPSHPNVVPLVGVCSSGKPLYIVASICEHGALHSFLSLRKAGPAGQQLTLTDKLTMAVQVASGMAHLHSMHLVHRDLACRNILVNALYVCQIADFGMMVLVV
eukprot:gene15597-27334_t